MITIPIWVFVLLIVLASITAILILLILISAFISIFSAPWAPEHIDCPDELEPADQNDNPEYIPPVSREE